MSSILNLRIIEEAEDATDMSSCSIALPTLLGDKSGRLFEVVGDKMEGCLVPMSWQIAQPLEWLE